MELLVAASIAGIVLAGAWGWLWNAAGAARKVGDHSQAATSAAAALRAMAAEAELAVGLSSPPDGLPPQRALSIIHRHAGQDQEAVVIAWDPARRVLWRKAPGTYLADRVTAFVVTYYDAQGAALSPAEQGDAEWLGRVARVAIVLTVTHRRAAVTARRDIAIVGA